MDKGLRVALRHATMLAAVAWVAGAAAAQGRDFSAVEIQHVPVRDDIHMLVGAGGNIGVSTGPDGVLVIDDQYAPLHEKIVAAVARLGKGEVRFVLNTHWHGDHTGGNEALGKAGAIIVAHEAVRARMASEQHNAFFDRTTPPSPAKALPVVTFEDGLRLHWNGHEIHAFHVDPAHTDGDAIVHFVDADVIHTGDTYFEGTYPFIDLSSGGSVEGLLAAMDAVIALAGPETKIIPGHGPLSDRAKLRAYRALVGGHVERVAAMVARGMSVDAILAAKPTADTDARYGGGFLKPDAYVRILATGLGAK